MAVTTASFPTSSTATSTAAAAPMTSAVDTSSWARSRARSWSLAATAAPSKPRSTACPSGVTVTWARSSVRCAMRAWCSAATCRHSRGAGPGRAARAGAPARARPRRPPPPARPSRCGRPRSPAPARPAPRRRPRPLGQGLVLDAPLHRVVGLVGDPAAQADGPPQLLQQVLRTGRTVRTPHLQGLARHHPDPVHQRAVARELLDAGQEADGPHHRHQLRRLGVRPLGAERQQRQRPHGHAHRDGHHDVEGRLARRHDPEHHQQRHARPQHPPPLLGQPGPGDDDERHRGGDEREVAMAGSVSSTTRSVAGSTAAMTPCEARNSVSQAMARPRPRPR